MKETANDHYVGSTPLPTPLPKRASVPDTADAAQARVDARFITALSNPRKATRFDRDTLAIIEARVTGLALDIEKYAPEGRLKSLALTHLEQSLTWVNKAIYLDGAVAVGDVPTGAIDNPPLGYYETGVSSKGDPRKHYRNRHNGIEVVITGRAEQDGAELDAWVVAPVDESGSTFVVSGQELVADYEELG